MSIPTLPLRCGLAGLVAAAMLSAPALAQDTASATEQQNAAQTRAAFDAWRAGMTTLNMMTSPSLSRYGQPARAARRLLPRSFHVLRPPA